MSYTIKIDAKNRKAKSIVNMLKELAQDYPFLHIYEDEPELPENIAEELEARYRYAKENPEEGKSWEEVKSNLLGK
ncbi:MAG: addiction module protein [Bacteroidales bacterium]|nr:addiction module protein [Bacteroidales bacterium]